MKASPWKQIGIALATLAGLSVTSAILWALYGNALVPAERMLPSDTAALVTNADAQWLRTLRQWMPSLANLPEASLTEIGALVTSGGELRPALLKPVRSLSSHPYEVQAAPDVTSRIGDPAETLESNPDYATLLPKKRPGALWAYAHPEQVGSLARLAPWSWLQVTRPFSISADDRSLEISLVDEAQGGLPTLSAAIPAVFARPIATVQGADLKRLWERLSTAIHPSTLYTLKSQAAEAVRERLGRDVSLAYDLAPLLADESALHLGVEGPDSRTRFLLEGTFGQGLEERLDQIVDSFRSALPAVKRETLAFEQGFTSDTLAQDEGAVQTQTLSVEGWTIRTVHHAESNRVLVAASKDNRFILSDSPAAVEARVRRTLSSVTVSGIDGSLLAAGLVNRKETAVLGATVFGDAWKTEASLPASFGETMSWSLSRERNKLVFRLENAVKPE